MGLKQTGKTLQRRSGSPILASDTSKPLMHRHMVFLMPIILKSFLFFLLINIFDHDLLSPWFAYVLVVPSELLFSHTLPYFPMVSSSQILVFRLMLVHFHFIRAWEAGVVQLLAHVSINLNFQAIDSDYCHIIAGCFVHVVAKAVRGSVVGILNPKVFLKELGSFLQKVVYWRWAYFVAVAGSRLIK